MIESLPVFAICGYSGSGKTTLILQLLARLCGERGLSVAILKNDVHGLQVDRPGKDTDRFFEAGADVHARGPKQRFVRAHPSDHEDLYARLRDLAEGHDLVLLEGHKGTPLPKVWLLSDGDSVPPEGLAGVLAVLDRDTDRLAAVWPLLETRLAEARRRTPLVGCVLIGGRSRRMGTPKHLIERDGRTWLEHTVAHLRGVCDDIVICGRGQRPPSVAGIPQLPDPPDAQGPIAGILSALRWRRNAQWLVAACDLPQLSAEALTWLLDQRAPGVWGLLPRLADSPGLEPLLAWYDGRCGPLIEALVAADEFSPLPLAQHPRIQTPAVPADLAPAWHNANTPQDLS